MSDITADVDIGRAVRIMWIDSGYHHDEGWSDYATFLKEGVNVMTVESVGIWMGENEDVVAIAQSRDEKNANWNAAQIILKKCIASREWLS